MPNQPKEKAARAHRLCGKEKVSGLPARDESFIIASRSHQDERRNEADGNYEPNGNNP